MDNCLVLWIKTRGFSNRGKQHSNLIWISVFLLELNSKLLIL